MKAIKIIIYLTTLVGVGIFLYFKRYDFARLIHLPIVDIIIIVIVGFATIYVNALTFRNNLSIFDFKLSFNEWFGLTVSNTMYNYLLPLQGGLAVRALYLNKNHKFPYSKYLSLTAGAYLLNLLIASFIAFIVSIYLNTFYPEKIKPIVLYVSLGLLLGFSIFIYLLYRFNANKIPKKNKALKFISNAAEGLTQFKSNLSLVRNFMVLQFLFMILTCFRLFLAFYALDISVNFVNLLLVNSLAFFAILVPITPGNIGVKEGIIGLTAGILSISVENALLGAVLDRLVIMLLIFFLGLIFSRILLIKEYQSESKQSNR